MAGSFDDHSTTVILEFLVQRLIVEQCKRSPVPAATFAGWLSAIGAERALFERHAFAPGTASEVSVNAIDVMGEFDRITAELSEKMKAANDP